MWLPLLTLLLLTTSVLSISNPNPIPIGIENPKGNDSFICDFCIFGVMWAEHKISNETDIPIIQKWVNGTICPLIPDNQRIFCYFFVDSYLPEFLKMIINKETPVEICNQIKLCSAEQKLWRILNLS